MLDRQRDIRDASAMDELLRVMHSSYPVAMVQLPSVFALIAPSTALGVNALNRAKQRLPGKYYGSAIGDLNAFLSLADQDTLPEAFRMNAASVAVMEGAFIRCRVTDAAVETATITAGTHQGLLLPVGPERALFKAIEQAFRKNSPNELFAGASYYAPICTSANFSGDPLGSIVDMQRARAFAQASGIPLFINNDNAQGDETGSYPIFAFEGNSVRVMRNGPAQERILRALPSSITVC